MDGNQVTVRCHEENPRHQRFFVLSSSCTHSRHSRDVVFIFVTRQTSLSCVIHYRRWYLAFQPLHAAVGYILCDGGVHVAVGHDDSLTQFYQRLLYRV